MVSTYVIKIDKNLDPVRDEKGFCIQSEPGERGLIVGILLNLSSFINSNYQK